MNEQVLDIEEEGDTETRYVSYDYTEREATEESDEVEENSNNQLETIDKEEQPYEPDDVMTDKGANADNTYDVDIEVNSNDTPRRSM